MYVERKLRICTRVHLQYIFKYNSPLDDAFFGNKLFFYVCSRYLAVSSVVGRFIQKKTSYIHKIELPLKQKKYRRNIKRNLARNSLFLNEASDDTQCIVD